MKHHCFINLKTYIERQYFGLGIQIVSLMYIGTFGDMYNTWPFKAGSII